nr:hypothetical protein [uncultured organism]
MTIQSEDGDRLTSIVARLGQGCPEALSGLKRLLRECEARYPGSIEQIAATLQLDRVRAAWTGSSRL